MAKDHSFDITSLVDLQEVTNAVEQTRKEILTRYDFKDSKSTLTWNTEAKEIVLQTENEFRLRSIVDILQTKFAKRGVSVRSMDFQTAEAASGGSLRQTIRIQQGIATEKAREIVKFIKDTKLKVQAQIQSDQIRAQAQKIDDLQEVIRLIKSHDFGIDFQFTNYR